jgi:hypothetical protein
MLALVNDRGCWGGYDRSTLRPVERLPQKLHTASVALPHALRLFRYYDTLDLPQRLHLPLGLHKHCDVKLIW